MNQEKPMLKLMRENYTFFGGLSLLYGIIVAFCLYENINGITFPIYIIATIIFSFLFMKKIQYHMVKGTWIYLVGMVLLGISTAMTTKYVMILFNAIGILLLFMIFMIRQFYVDKKWNFPQYLERMGILIGTSIVLIPLPFTHGIKFLSEGQSKKKKKVLAILIGLIISLLLMAIIIPLLLSSDMIFAKLFNSFLKYINIPTIIGNGILIIVGVISAYAFFAALGSYNFPAAKEKKVRTFSPIIGITFTAVLAFIYLIYSGIQIIYVFAGVQKGLPENVTYAQYAHTGFYQLLIVGIINFILVMICMYIFNDHLALKILLTIICGCTFIMLISAVHRMMLYVGEYNLTFLRVLVLWFLCALVLIMSGVIVSIYRPAFPLFKFIVGVVACMYIALSLSRPDAWIATYDINHVEKLQDTDVEYLMSRLSNDAAPAIASIDPKEVYVSMNNEDRDEFEKSGMEGSKSEDIGYKMYQYFSNEVKDNPDIYFRKANYSKIVAVNEAEKWMKENAEYKDYYDYLYGYGEDSEFD